MIGPGSDKNDKGGAVCSVMIWYDIEIPSIYLLHIVSRYQCSRDIETLSCAQTLVVIIRTWIFSTGGLEVHLMWQKNVVNVSGFFVCLFFQFPAVYYHFLSHNADLISRYPQYICCISAQVVCSSVIGFQCRQNREIASKMHLVVHAHTYWPTFWDEKQERWN